MIRRSWTQAASIEETLALWAASLREIKKRIRPLFTQERVATNAGLFLEGLLGDEQRKTGWMRAEAAGDPGPWRQQAILGRGDWAADALRDIVRDYVIEHLADDDAVLVIDETGFLKQGKASCGVARQYTGSAGKITNCQIGVFACLRFVPRSCVHRPRAVSSEGMDRRSRSPGSRICACRYRLCTKPKLATRMIARAIAASVRSSGLLVTRSTVLVISNSNCVGQAKAMCSGSAAPCISIMGQASDPSPVRPQTCKDAALIRLETPVGRDRNQRTAAA